MAKKIKKVEPQHKGDTFALPEPAKRSSAEIKRAKNGYVVSSYKDGQEHLYIAKSKKEAHTHAHKLLKVGL